MKNSSRYLERFWSYRWFWSNWQHIYGHSMSTLYFGWTQGGHRYAVNLTKINDNSETVQDILMKFSPDVNHNSVVNWWKNFGRSTTDMFATPLFVSKLCEGLAPTLFEIFPKKIFLVRFYTHISYQMSGISNISQKMAFWNFWNECSIQRKLSNPWSH